MTLAEPERDRLVDIQDLQPTTNAELSDRWGMNSGSEVAAYLRNELDEYTYRDKDRKIRVDTDAPINRDAEAIEDTPSEHGGAAGQETDATPNSREVAPDADVSPSDRDDGQLAAVESAPADSTVDKDTSDDTDSDPSNNDNPTFGTVDPDAEPDPDPEPDTPNQVELPCGCESYEPTEAPERPFAVTCSTCGTSYRVTPDGEANDDDRVRLPCGCESFDPAEAPDKPLVVSCGTCGERYKVTP